MLSNPLQNIAQSCVTDCEAVCRLWVGRATAYIYNASRNRGLYERMLNIKGVTAVSKVDASNVTVQRILSTGSSGW